MEKGFSLLSPLKWGVFRSTRTWSGKIYFLSFSKIFLVVHLLVCPTTSDLSVSPALAWIFIISNKIFLPFLTKRPGPSSYLWSARFFPSHQLSPKALEPGGDTPAAQHLSPAVPGAVQEGSQQHSLSFMAQRWRKCSLTEALPHSFPRQSCSGTGE